MRLTRAVWIALGTLGTVFTFLFSYRFILNHFGGGPYLLDTGWFAYAIYRQGLVLPNLPHLQSSYGPSIFTQHVYALPGVLSPLSYAFPTHCHYFASYLGGTYALTFLAPFLAVRALKQTLPWAFIAAAVGLAVAFSGAVLAAIGYPHFEMAIPALFVIFLSLHFLGFPRAKWLALAAGLLVREDAGLHYFGYCVLIGAYQAWKKLDTLPRKTLLTTMGVTFGASALILFVQRRFFPLGESMFHKSYVGDPPFAHLNAAELGTRLSNFWDSAAHLYGPALVIVLTALVLRAPAFVLGYAAVLPWVVINVVFSLTLAARTLSLYYGFPLLVGMMWPLLAAHWMPGNKRALLGVPLVALAAMLSTYLLENRWPIDAARAGGFFSVPIYRRVSNCLKQEWARTPNLYADSSVVSMFPDVVPADRMVYAPNPPKDDADGFVFYEGPNVAFYREQARRLGLEHERSMLPVLPLRIASRTPSPLIECVGPPWTASLEQ